MALVLVLSGTAVLASGPRSEALKGWDAYVAATEARRASEIRRAGQFLALDFAEDAAAERQAVMRGETVVRQVSGAGAKRGDLSVPSALVHHWRGAVFVPGTTVAALVAALEAAPPPQEDVLAARVLARDGPALTVYLRLRRTRIVTVVYDTEHQVRFERLGPGRAASTSMATRIVEIDNPGGPNERALTPEEDHGFLWRLNAYWRYQDVEGGVIAECESLTLSRPVPFGLGTIAGPIIRSTARESMAAALMAVARAGTR